MKHYFIEIYISNYSKLLNLDPASISSTSIALGLVEGSATVRHTTESVVLLLRLTSVARLLV